MRSLKGLRPFNNHHPPSPLKERGIKEVGCRQISSGVPFVCQKVYDDSEGK